ncbi:MAG: hypothetical protein ACREP9_14750, partial [Candidatus Dormibacteraceae bacterium]
ASIHAGLRTPAGHVAVRHDVRLPSDRAKSLAKIAPRIIGCSVRAGVVGDMWLGQRCPRRALIRTALTC